MVRPEAPIAAVLALALLSAATAASPAVDAAVADPGPDATDAANASADGVDPRIVELLPNPVAGGDAGEYVRLVLPPGNWTVTDGESAATIDRDDPGAVVVTAEPDALLAPPEGGVVAGELALANGGERVELRRGSRNGPVVDAVEYGRAPEGERWLRDADRRWRPVGLPARDPVDVGGTNATAFVLPDAPGPPVDTVADADRRLLLAGYTFTSERVATELIDAHRRGVDVRVLLEGDPVGGVSRAEARLLDRLVAAGVEVRVVGGRHARVRYHHAKYAVADDSALVLTENWKPAGTGGADSRGWGVVLRSGRAADALAALFRTDAGWRDAVAWEEFSAGRTFGADDGDRTGDRSYPRRHPPTDVRPERVGLLTAPGNAEAGVVAVVEDADERVDVIQPTVSEGPLLAATRRAAGRGVEVRLLLSGAWYVAEENAALAEELNRWAERADVPFEARIADPAGRYGKIHAKGVVADDTAVVGSLNWNPTSARENREVVVVAEGAAVADYYRRVFAADWRASGEETGLRPVPPALAVAAVGAAALAVLYARRRFAVDGRRAVDDEEGGPIG